MVEMYGHPKLGFTSCFNMNLKCPHFQPSNKQRQPDRQNSRMWNIPTDS